MHYTPNCIIKYYKTTTGKATGDIDINDRKLVEEKYYLGEEASDLAFNTYHAYMGHQDREEDLDEIFKAYQRYLLTTGESEGEKDSLVKILPKTIFQNNLYSPQDKKEVNVLISSICHLNENQDVPRSVSMQELQELWNKNGIEAYRPKLAEAITLLLERKVLVQSEDEFIPVYRLSVDLFRRWWKVHYPDIKLEITTIQ